MELSLHVMRPENPLPQDREVFEQCFNLWKEVWSATFQELDGDPTIHSDGFCRQTRMLALRHGSRVVGLVMQHDLDFSLPTGPLDSYFKIWPEGAVQKLLRDGPRVMVGSNTTVHLDYRGDLGGGLKLKDLLVGVGVKCFVESESDVLMAIMRCQKGLHKTAHRYGAVTLQEGLVMHNQQVELMGFYRRQLSSPGALVPDLGVEGVWKNRTIHDSETVLLSQRTA